MKLEFFHTLSDRAVALHYALEIVGGRPTIDDLKRITGKSQASLYRALAELQDAGLQPLLSPRAQQPPPPPKRRRYS